MFSNWYTKEKGYYQRLLLLEARLSERSLSIESVLCLHDNTRLHMAVLTVEKNHWTHLTAYIYYCAIKICLDHLRKNLDRNG